MLNQSPQQQINFINHLSEHGTLCSLDADCMFSSLTVHSSVLQQVELNQNHGTQTSLDQQQKCVCTVSSYCRCRTTEGTTAQWASMEYTLTHMHAHTNTHTHRVGRTETFVSASVSRKQQKQQSCGPEQREWVELGLGGG